MKHQRNGQSRVLSSSELDRLIQALPAGQHQTMATLMRFTACRVSEARQLTWGCVGAEEILLPKGVTKGKLASRAIPAHPQLLNVLVQYRLDWAALKGREPENGEFLFPGLSRGSCITRQAFGRVLTQTALRVGLQGVSTHSFRRSALTAASAAGIPLADLRTLSGHRSLQTLQRYLETSPEAKRKAALAFA